MKIDNRWLIAIAVVGVGAWLLYDQPKTVYTSPVIKTDTKVMVDEDKGYFMEGCMEKGSQAYCSCVYDELAINGKAWLYEMSTQMETGTMTDRNASMFMDAVNQCIDLF
jgi:hypothetical protein